MNFISFITGLRSKWHAAARVRIMTYALAASVLCGVIGLLNPVDDAIRNFRYFMRDVPADKSIVVVGVDKKSIEALGGRWPWSRDVESMLISKLKSAGVERIVFDRALADADQPESDARFIEILKRVV